MGVEGPKEESLRLEQFLQFVRKNRNGVGNFLVGFHSVWENKRMGHEFPARAVRHSRTIFLGTRLCLAPRCFRGSASLGRLMSLKNAVARQSLGRSGLPGRAWEPVNLRWLAG